MPRRDARSSNPVVLIVLLGAMAITTAAIITVRVAQLDVDDHGNGISSPRPRLSQHGSHDTTITSDEPRVVEVAALRPTTCATSPGSTSGSSRSSAVSPTSVEPPPTC